MSLAEKQKQKEKEKRLKEKTKGKTFLISSKNKPAFYQQPLRSSANQSESPCSLFMPPV